MDQPIRDWAERLPAVQRVEIQDVLFDGLERRVELAPVNEFPDIKFEISRHAEIRADNSRRFDGENTRAAAGGRVFVVGKVLMTIILIIIVIALTGLISD